MGPHQTTVCMRPSRVTPRLTAHRKDTKQYSSPPSAPPPSITSVVSPYLRRRAGESNGWMGGGQARRGDAHVLALAARPRSARLQSPRSQPMRGAPFQPHLASSASTSEARVRRGK